MKVLGLGAKSKLEGRDRKVRLLLLGLCTIPLAGAYSYNQGYRIPLLSCPIRHLTGIPCPSCGMTRSFMAIARGDWSQAVSYHLFGPVLFTGLAIAIVHLTLELMARRTITTWYCKLAGDRQFQVVSLVLFLSYYALRLYDLSRTGALSVAFLNSPAGHLLFLQTNANA